MAANKSFSHWVDVFHKFDKDKSGTLDEVELRALIKQLHSHLSDGQLADFFVFFDGPQGDKKITLEEFLNGLKKLESFSDEMSSLFMKFDTDGDGYLNKAEVQELLGKHGQHFKGRSVEQFIQEMDISGDGKISLAEFINACT
ncbi:calmodulin-like [Physella acuta]|uniref:calmodulin-like n=1 Tax=Physella acuta TaxID=109671 RepID=UPI0027DE7264|nr:calmodulin-like [Physella acuta]XP_059161746.1 calmodulin-like [Physella acuta]